MRVIPDISSGNTHVVYVDGGFKVDGINHILKTRVVTITFIKTDGSEREMVCTLRPEFLPKAEIANKERTKVVNPMVVTCWDVKKSAWRSFKVETIKQIDDTLDNGMRLVYAVKGS